MGNQWRTMRNAFKDFYDGLRHGKSNYAGAMDVHSRLMAKYPEVPDCTRPKYPSAGRADLGPP